MRKSIVAFLKGIVLVMAVLVLVVGISGCQKKEEGAMEQSGKAVDEGIQSTTDAVKEAGEKAGEKVGEGVEATKDVVKEAGVKIGEGAEKTKEAAKEAAEKVENKVKE